MLKHSFPPVARTDARLLVCGSLPGEASLAAGRYYAHPQNQFWRLMSPVVGVDLVPLDYAARLDALGIAGVALWDVVGSARRSGSSDMAIRDAVPNPLADLVATLPQLAAVAFNGGTAAKAGTPLVTGLGLAIVALPSSSPLHTIGVARKQPAWAALRRFL